MGQGLKVVSLFDGVSCGRVALERLGLTVSAYEAFEIDKFAKAVSRYNYPDIHQHGDVLDADFSQFAGYDLVMGGSPCTFWSIAKNNREVDKNGVGWKLFMRFVEAVRIIRPRCFLYENVASMPASIKAYISEELGCEPILINSALVSAQHRKRLYWTNISGVAQPEDKGILLKDILESGMTFTDKSYCITATYAGATFEQTLQKKKRTTIAEPIALANKSQTILSDVQLEAVSYAGQSHSQTLPNGATRGFFLGDGTGVGKGRTITGVILDNYTQGRKKAVWLSENRGLVPDAKRDVAALFGNSDLVTEFEGGKKADKSLSNDEAILFTTYSALSKGFDQSGSNFEKIVNWLGKDFDGVIVFDEAHNMANSIATKGSRGIKKASQRGMAGLAIQEALPKAKIIYSSATGATEVENLRYAERLGLWGEGTAFPNGDDFVHRIKAGGLAAMELIARDMKAMGVYLSRNISYEDVVYDKIVHELTPEQRQIYDELARSWQIVLQNINKALETTNQDKDGMAISFQSPITSCVQQSSAPAASLIVRAKM